MRESREHGVERARLPLKGEERHQARRVNAARCCRCRLAAGPYLLDPSQSLPHANSLPYQQEVHIQHLKEY